MSVALASGETFAGYRIESVVGRGGMGVVYRATDLRLERPVALKLVAPELAEDERVPAAVPQGAEARGRARPPERGPDLRGRRARGRLYLAMRFVDGSDMRTLLRQEGGLPLERSLAILEQVASALDAAHRRDLVHRDVKPANVLVDEDGHAYLTDFGVTKQLGGDSTDTGQIVGTLDYLAPEQIRGEDLERPRRRVRARVRAFECLTGAPPFRRATEAETLWAHMQDPVPPVPGRPELDPVLRKALAKEPGDRYGSCAELIEAARLALAGVRVPVRLVRRRWAIVAAGLLALAAVACDRVDARTTARRHGRPRRPPATALARIASGGERIASFTPEPAPRRATSRSARAVSGCSTPRTRRSPASIRAAARSSGLSSPAAARPISRQARARCGSGSKPGRTDVAVAGRSRDRARSRAPSASRRATSGLATEGFPTIAVGAGGVWAINPDETVSRIDAASGRLVTTISPPAGASTIAAGGEGVWVLGWENKLYADRPDARTASGTRSSSAASRLGDRRRRRIGLGDVGGGGCCGASSPDRDRSSARSTSAPACSTSRSATARSGPRTGTTARSRASTRATNAVTARVPVGAVQALAAGAGSAWVSIAGGARNGVLPASTCGEVAAGGRTPDVLVATDMPLGSGAAPARARSPTLSGS